MVHVIRTVPPFDGMMPIATSMTCFRSFLQLPKALVVRQEVIHLCPQLPHLLLRSLTTDLQNGLQSMMRVTIGLQPFDRVTVCQSPGFYMMANMPIASVQLTQWLSQLPATPESACGRTARHPPLFSPALPRSAQPFGAPLGWPAH
jgi:hypothetical protein